MPSDSEYYAAISKVRSNPKTASRQDWDLVQKAAKQAGAMGNDARSALNGK